MNKKVAYDLFLVRRTALLSTIKKFRYYCSVYKKSLTYVFILRLKGSFIINRYLMWPIFIKISLNLRRLNNAQVRVPFR